MPIPAIVASHAGIWRADNQGNCSAISQAEALRRLGDSPHLLLNAPQLAARLGLAEATGLDLLELWAFVWPARFLVPSAGGLATALKLEPPAAGAAEAGFLQAAAGALLAQVEAPNWPPRTGAADSLERLARRGWAWSDIVADSLGRSGPTTPLLEALPEWADPPPRPAPVRKELTGAEVDQTLAHLVGSRREPRSGQTAYARAALHAFQPRESRDGPNMVVAQAGTGIGKTLGYLAPASLYARQTGGLVWLSTFTRALQRQLKAECETSLPDMVQGGKIVVRKGRENYLCLLNLEDALQGSFSGRAAVFAELVARWARFTADGDMVGGDLPGWLPGLFRPATALRALTDRRGECIRAACPHYRRCFIERSVRDAASASLVIASHALVMANTARGNSEGHGLSRLVFDEGHHLHAAADSAFAIALTGAEAIELRRWLLGPENPRRRTGRRRGLDARLSDVASYDGPGGTALEQVLDAARALPAADWLSRITSGEPHGPIETLLAAIRFHVQTQAAQEERGFTLEAAIAGMPPELMDAAEGASATLARLSKALLKLHARLGAIATELPEWLDQPGIARLYAAAEGISARARLIDAWTEMLARLGGAGAPQYVDWFTLVRADGREIDCGMMRHWLDPLQPLARTVLAPADGVLVTSATLGDPPEASTGAAHLAIEPHLFRAASPFDYAAQARVWVATDVNRRDMASLAHAYAALIEAAGGGTLGLFTAIARLRAVHARLADRLARAGLPLFAQHVDAVDTGTLVDLFRADPRASLFGTDALRDGVDVPGDSLRLLVFEGVPWSRPTILHTARRLAFGGAAYEDTAVRHRLQQAFGRLIRSSTDRGGFVLLGASVPSRILDALPPEVPVRRLPLAEIETEVRAFLGGDCAAPGAPLGLGQASGDSRNS